MPSSSRRGGAPESESRFIWSSFRSTRGGRSPNAGGTGTRDGSDARDGEAGLDVAEFGS